MSYDLHITRAGWDVYGREYPISRQEWRAVAQTWPGLTLSGRIDYGDTGPVAVYSLQDGDADSTSLYWRNGSITVVGAGYRTAPIARLAERLRARLVGQDGELYLPDGTVVDGDAGTRAPLITRPLYVNEVAGAWQSLLDREDSDDDGSVGVATQVLRSFTRLAMREVATCDVPDADMLLYSYDERWFKGEQTFTLAMARQFTQDDESGGDIVRVICEARYEPTPELMEIKAFGQWVPAGDEDERRAWLEGIAARPEWTVLDSVVPFEVVLCGRDVYHTRIAAMREKNRAR